MDVQVTYNGYLNRLTSLNHCSHGLTAPIIDFYMRLRSQATMHRGTTASCALSDLVAVGLRTNVLQMQTCVHLWVLRDPTNDSCVPRSADDKRTVAIHESGHAVAGAWECFIDSAWKLWNWLWEVWLRIDFDKPHADVSKETLNRWLCRCAFVFFSILQRFTRHTG